MNKVKIMITDTEGNKEVCECYGFVLAALVDDPNDPDKDDGVVYVLDSNNADREAFFYLANEAKDEMMRLWSEEILDD